MRGPLESMGMRSLLGLFGDRNASKLIDIVLAAMARLPEDVHLVLAGRPILGYDLDALVRESGLGSRVTVATDVSDEDFLAWMCASDVTATLDLALAASGGPGSHTIAHRPRLLSDNGASMLQAIWPARRQRHAACAWSPVSPAGKDRALAPDSEEPHSARPLLGRVPINPAA